MTTDRTAIEVADIAGVGATYHIEAVLRGPEAPSYRVRIIPGGPSDLARPIVLHGATWAEAMDYVRDAVSAQMDVAVAALGRPD